MSSSTLAPKFLIDENVHHDLVRYLRRIKVDFKLVRKGSGDSFVAQISKKEKRILVTNDSDFAYYKEDRIYSVVILRLPQSEPELLIKSFGMMAGKAGNFSGKLIILSKDNMKILVLGKPNFRCD